MKLKRDGYFLGSMLHHPIFIKENPCLTGITNPHLGTAVTDNNSKYVCVKPLPYEPSFITFYSKYFCTPCALKEIKGAIH